MLFRSDQPNGVNLDWNGSLSYRLSSQSSWISSVYSSYTPQMISPRTTFNIVNRYSHQIPWWGSGRFLSLTAGHGWQRNRYERSIESEFDRQTLLAGIRVPLIRNMSYYTNYEYSWAVDIYRDTTSHPQVWSSGIDYFLKINEPLSLTMDLRYRDEQNSEGTFTFLSGEDYIRGSLGLNYRPSADMEIYCDGSLRSVWTENPENPAFNDADIRLGVRASWDSFFRWSPQGTFTGTIYKDLNYNQHLDPNEPGIPGIGVKVGNQLVTTDDLGRYYARVRAKKVRVALDVSSLPQGFLTTNGYSKDQLVENGDRKSVV